MTTIVDQRRFCARNRLREQTFDGSVPTFNEVSNAFNFAISLAPTVLSGWVYPTAFDENNSTIFSQKDGTGTGRSWLLLDTSVAGEWRSVISGSNLQFNTITNANLNTWYYFVLTHNAIANTVNLSVTPFGGSTETEQKTSVTMESATGNLVIGTSKSESTNNAFDGRMRDLKLNGSSVYNGEYLLRP